MARGQSGWKSKARKFETGKAIPQEVLVKRAEARVAIVNT